VRREVPAVAPSTGRVDQLVPQRDQHALDAGDLIQDRGDEDFHVAAARSFRHPALTDHGGGVARGPGAANRQLLGKRRTGRLELLSARRGPAGLCRRTPPPAKETAACDRPRLDGRLPRDQAVRARGDEEAVAGSNKGHLLLAGSLLAIWRGRMRGSLLSLLAGQVRRQIRLVHVLGGLELRPGEALGIPEISSFEICVGQISSFETCLGEISS
jgi:hypothetical protein